MTALFIVIFVEQWFDGKNRFPAVCGVVISVIGILIFGRENFILPSMIIILLALLAYRKVPESKFGKGEQ